MSTMKKHHDSVILTTIFPVCEGFLGQFFDSLVAQTVRDFDVFVLNDGIDLFHDILAKYPQLNILEHRSSLSPVKNREIAIKEVLQLGYKSIIFGDSDDYFEKNRVEVCLDKLKKYDVVVNDLVLFNSDGILSSNYISQRFDNDSEITLDDVLNKNIFGLSNTAVNTKVIQNTDFEDGVTAFDWLFFSEILSGKASAIFTNETVTYYRQYEANTVGLGDNSLASIQRSLQVKSQHYGAMAKKNKVYESLLTQVQRLTDKGQEMTEDSIQDVDANTHYLWWENTELIK